MPGLLIDAIPFSGPRDPGLTALVETLEAALAPDALELVFRLQEDLGTQPKVYYLAQQD